MSDSLQPHGLYSPWNSPGQKTGVGSLSLLQGILPTQGSNPGLLHCRWILYKPQTKWKKKRERETNQFAVFKMNEIIKLKKKKTGLILMWWNRSMNIQLQPEGNGMANKPWTFLCRVFSYVIFWASVQFSQLCLTPCHPRDCSMPRFPVHHQLLELAQTHVHWVGDAIQPSKSNFHVLELRIINVFM